MRENKYDFIDSSFIKEVSYKQGCLYDTIYVLVCLMRKYFLQLIFG